jgi:hypothetical protein
VRVDDAEGRSAKRRAVVPAPDADVRTARNANDARNGVCSPQENRPALLGNCASSGACDAEYSERGAKNPRHVVRRSRMRRHHEELAVLPALSLLLPFAGALWLRIKAVSKKSRD